MGGEGHTLWQGKEQGVAPASKPPIAADVSPVTGARRHTGPRSMPCARAPRAPRSPLAAQRSHRADPPHCAGGLPASASSSFSPALRDGCSPTSFRPPGPPLLVFQFSAPTVARHASFLASALAFVGYERERASPFRVKSPAAAAEATGAAAAGQVPVDDVGSVGDGRSGGSPRGGRRGGGGDATCAPSTRSTVTGGGASTRAGRGGTAPDVAAEARTRVTVAHHLPFRDPPPACHCPLFLPTSSPFSPRDALLCVLSALFVPLASFNVRSVVGERGGGVGGRGRRRPHGRDLCVVPSYLVQ